MALEMLKSRKPVSVDPADVLGAPNTLPLPPGVINLPPNNSAGTIPPEALAAMKTPTTDDVAAPADGGVVPPTIGSAAQNIGDINNSMNAETAPKLARQGSKNPFLHALQRVIGLVGDQPKPGEEYEGPTSTAGKIANALRFASGVGTSLAAASGNLKPAELELQRENIAATRGLQRAQMAETARYHSGMIENAQRRDQTTRDTNQLRYGDQSATMLRAKTGAAKEGLKVGDNGELVNQSPDELSPALQSKIDLQQAQALRAQAAVELDKARRDALANPNSPQMQLKWYEAKARLAMAERRLAQGDEHLDLARQANARAEDKINAPSPAAQNVIMSTRPIKNQVLDLLEKLEPLKDNNTPAYFLAPRVKYSMGIHDNTSDIAGSMSELELSRPLEAARILKGSSRAYAALQQGQIHTPDPWRDSPQMMYNKLLNIYNNMDDLENDAAAFGNPRNYKNGHLPNPAPSKFNDKNPPPKGGGAGDNGGGKAGTVLMVGPDGTQWNVPTAKVSKFEANHFKRVQNAPSK